MRYTIRNDDTTAFTLCEDNRIASILQNLYLLITVREGTVPMYRRFGLSQNYIDKPIPIAQTMMISEVREKISEFEPRATYVGLSFEYSEGQPGKMVTILEVEI